MTNHPNRGRRYRVRRADDRGPLYWRGGRLIPGWTRDPKEAKAFTKSAGNQFIDSPARLPKVLYELEEI